MENKNLFLIDINWNLKTIGLFAFLVIMPNLLGMINFQTHLGFNIHMFPILIFISAAIYGPMGGAMSGGVGSLFSAISMHNPYLIIGNIILGFFTGLFFKKGMALLFSVLLSFIIQISWILISDIYFMNMPINILWILVISLLISNIMWGTMAQYSYKHVRQILK